VGEKQLLACQAIKAWEDTTGEAGGVQSHHLLEMEVVVLLEEATSIIIPNGKQVEEAGEVTVVVVVGIALRFTMTNL